MAGKGKSLAKMGKGKPTASKGTKAEQRVAKALSDPANKGVPIKFAEASKKQAQTVDPSSFTPDSPSKFKARPTSSK